MTWQSVVVVVVVVGEVVVPAPRTATALANTVETAVATAVATAGNTAEKTAGNTVTTVATGDVPHPHPSRCRHDKDAAAVAQTLDQALVGVAFHLLPSRCRCCLGSSSSSSFSHYPTVDHSAISPVEGHSDYAALVCRCRAVSHCGWRCSGCETAAVGSRCSWGHSDCAAAAVSRCYSWRRSGCETAVTSH